jgi:hypothetical protein
MKNLLLVSMILFAGVASGQTLRKGNLVGVHVDDIKLAPGVTMGQYTDFVVKKYIPEYEKAFGSKVYLVKGIRGENKNRMGWFIIYDSEEKRNKYFQADGNLTPTVGTQAQQKLQSLTSELNKLGSSKPTYTDWILQ